MLKSAFHSTQIQLLHCVYHSVPLFRHDGNDCVYVLAEDSTITCRPVTIDRNASAAQAVVTSGLSAEDRVVKAGAGMLHNGEKVRVIEQPSETNVGGLL